MVQSVCCTISMISCYSLNAPGLRPVFIFVKNWKGWQFRLFFQKSPFCRIKLSKRSNLRIPQHLYVRRGSLSSYLLFIASMSMWTSKQPLAVVEPFLPVWNSARHFSRFNSAARLAEDPAELQMLTDSADPNAGRFVRYQFTPEFLKLKTVGAT